MRRVAFLLAIFTIALASAPPRGVRPAGACFLSRALEVRGGATHEGGGLAHVFKKVIKKLLSFLLGSGPEEEEELAATAEDFEAAFAAAVDLEEDESCAPSGQLILGGTFSRALKVAQARGLPLLVVLPRLADPSSDALWGAVTDGAALAMLREGKVVAWGAWLASAQGTRASKAVKIAPADRSAGVAALVRPRQGGGEPKALATFPPQTGKSKKVPKGKARGVTGARLAAWVSSTTRRFAAELAADSKMAEDKAIAVEISQGFAEGLAADSEREARERAEKEAKARAEKEAREAAAAEAKAKQAEKERKQALRTELGPEPPKPGTSSGDARGVATVAVRLPDGSRRSRRFRVEEATVASLLDWLDADCGLGADLKAGAIRLSLAGQSAKKKGGFACSGRGDPVEAKTLASLGFHERPVLLTAERTERTGTLKEPEAA